MGVASAQLMVVLRVTLYLLLLLKFLAVGDDANSFVLLSCLLLSQ